MISDGKIQTFISSIGEKFEDEIDCIEIIEDEQYELVIGINHRQKTVDLLNEIEAFNQRCLMNNEDSLSIRIESNSLEDIVLKTIELEFGSKFKHLSETLPQVETMEDAKNIEKKKTKNVGKNMEEVSDTLNAESIDFDISSNSRQFQELQKKEDNYQLNGENLTKIVSNLLEETKNLKELTFSKFSLISRLQFIIKRRFLLLKSNPVQYFSILSYIICPLILSYILNDGTENMKINQKEFYFLIGIIILTILFICSFYGLIISQEKQSGLRFYLKAKNISSWIYISGNLIADSILGCICMLVIVSGSMFLISIG